MKFTRIFILRTLNTRDDGSHSQNPLEVLKEIIISHPNIDFIMALLLSVFLLITKYNDDYNYIYSNSINIYFITMTNVVTLLYYFALEHLDQITMTDTGMRSIESGRGINASNGSNIINGNNNNQNNSAEENNNVNNNLDAQNPPNNPLEFLSFSSSKRIKLPMILFNNWHFFKSALHLIKILTTTLTFFLSLIFCMLYNDQKNRLDKERYLLIHLLILDFYEFYSGFRVCYFLVKIMINIILLPIYFSAVILGYIEDRFNDKLNKLVNTKFYTGRSSIKFPANGRVSEMEEYCSICLNSFQLEEMVSTLPCSRRHTFHTVCLEKWFLTTVTCPLCRSDFQSSMDFIINGGVSNREQRPFELQQNLL